MTEDKILAGNFLFVSYSHRDIDSVREDVCALQAMGARIWFDENMRIGDNWQTIAKEKIGHPNCKGVIFYNSAASFLSDAVLLERQEAIARAKSEKGFGVYSVNLEGKTMQQLYAEAMNAGKPGFLGIMFGLRSHFSDETLYIPRFDSKDCVEQIYAKVVRPNLVVDEAALFQDAFRGYGGGARRGDRIPFGSYFGAPCTAPLKHSKPTERFFANDIEYISYNNAIYGVRTLEWDLLYAENAAAVLLCTEILDFACGGAGAKHYLEETFAPLAFSAKERELLCAEPRLLTPADIEKAKELFAPEGKGAHRHWWIEADGLMESWKMTYCGNTPYPNGFNVMMRKGIRPVIELPIEKLKQVGK